MNRENHYIYCMWMNIDKPDSNYVDDDNWLLAFHRSKNNKLIAWNEMGVGCVVPYLKSEFWLTKQDIKRISKEYHIKLNVIPVNCFKDYVEKRIGKGEFFNTAKYVLHSIM